MQIYKYILFHNKIIVSTYISICYINCSKLFLHLKLAIFY